MNRNFPDVDLVIKWLAFPLLGLVFVAWLYGDFQIGIMIFSISVLVLWITYIIILNFRKAKDRSVSNDINQGKNFDQLTKVAKFLVFSIIALNLGMYCYGFLSGNDEGIGFPLFAFGCTLWGTFLLIAAALRFLRRHQITKNKTIVNRIANCIFWWTSVGIMFSFTGLVFMLIGFICLIFTLFLWFDLALLAYKQWRTG